MAATEYILQPRPPVRAFLTAAVVCALSVALIAVATSREWHIAVTIVAIVLLVAGCALMGAGFASIKRMQVIVSFDDDGYLVRGLGKERSGTWESVSKVTETTDGRHITIYHGNVERTHLLCPSGTGGGQFRAMLADMSGRLDQAHGYGR